PHDPADVLEGLVVPGGVAEAAVDDAVEAAADDQVVLDDGPQRAALELDPRPAERRPPDVPDGVPADDPVGAPVAVDTLEVGARVRRQLLDRIALDRDPDRVRIA